MSPRSPRRPPREVTPVACLTVLASPDRDAESRIHLLGTATCIGREPAEAELVAIADPSLALRHCRIVREPDCYTLEELTSPGAGCWIEGQPVEGQRSLRPGDLIRCGDTLLLLHELDLAAVRWVHPRASGLGGRSGALIAALRQLVELARATSPDAATPPVLLLGEAGSGRQRLAWELHRREGRGGPFLSYDCLATPPERHHGDLFGRAAAPGREAVEPGLLRLVGRGTLFLGNLEALAPEAAAALWARLGPALPGRHPARASEPEEPAPPPTWRLVASATTWASPPPPVPAPRRRRETPPPARSVQQELARLFAATTVVLPPLRQRRDDVLPLLRRFLASVGRPRRCLEPRQVRLHPDLAEALLLHPWPGNIDELRLVAQRMLLLRGPTAQLEPELAEWLGLAPGAGRRRTTGAQTPAAGAGTGEAGPAVAPRSDLLPPPPPPGQAPTAEQLARCHAIFAGSVRRIAQYLGRDRRLVYRWLDRYGLTRTP